jgi:hypothetical protein
MPNSFLVNHEVCHKEVTNAEGKIPKNYKVLISIDQVACRTEEIFGKINNEHIVAYMFRAFCHYLNAISYT